MANLGTLEYTFKINDDGTAVIKKIEGQVKSSMSGMASASTKATTAMQSGWAGLKGNMGGFSDLKGQIMGLAGNFISLYAAWRGVKAVFSFLSESVKASNEQIAAITKLDVSLQNMGFNVAQTSQDFQNFSTQMQSQTGIADEVVLSQMGMMTAFGGTADEIKAATQAALDMSATTGKDFETTSMLMAKALAGNITMFKKFGITIDETKFKQEGFSAVTDALSKFQGAAAAQGQTYEGVIKRLGTAYNDYQEAVGDVITKNLELRAALDTVIMRVVGMTSELNTNTQAYSKLVTDGVGMAITALEILDGVYRLTTLNIDMMTTGVLALATALGGLTYAATYAAQGIASILNIIPSVRNFFSETREKIGSFTSDMYGGLQQSVESTTTSFEDLMKVGSDWTGVRKEISDTRKELEKIQAKPKVGGGGGLPAAARAKAGGGGAAKKEEWAVPSDREQLFSAYESERAMAKDTADKKRQSEAMSRMSAMDKMMEQQRKNPDWYWQEFAMRQREFTSPQSTFTEQQEGFTKLQEMYKQADAANATFGDHSQAMWQAFSGGVMDASNQMNTYLQTMSTLGETAFNEISNAFQNTFSALMKGDIRALGGIWKNFVQNMLNAFISAISQMLVKWLMFKAVTAIFGPGSSVVSLLFGGGAAKGAVFPGHFAPFQAFATGGVTDRPTLGMIGEGSKPEAVVPLPDGRSIPVSMSGGQERSVNISIVNTLDASDIVSKAATRSPQLFINPIVADYESRGVMHKIVSRGGK